MAPIFGVSHLSNPLATPKQLANSASQLDGVPIDLEDSIRYESIRLIQAAGILLRLPQELIAETIVIFSRFWLGPEGGSLLVYAAKVCTALQNMVGAGLIVVGCCRRFDILGHQAICTSDRSSTSSLSGQLCQYVSAWKEYCAQWP